MKKRHFDAILVIGDTTFGNPNFRYVVGANLPRGGVYLKKFGKEPVLIVSNIDLGSAEKSQVKQTRTFSEYEYEKLSQKFERSQALILLYERILKKHRTSGKIGLFGRIEAAGVLRLAEGLRKLGLHVVGDRHPTLIEALREIKTSQEMEKISELGEKTERVMKRITALLKDCTIREDELYCQGQRLTVGIVKKHIGRFLAEENLVASEDTIFAVGPKSADPHYHGENSDLVFANKPIVFDIFPQEVGGYCFDMTRTFVVGDAPPKIKEMHELVRETQLLTLGKLRHGAEIREIVDSACENFERHGYRTIRSLMKGDKKALTFGFTHSLGHGVGLTIGERPFLTLFTRERLRTGHIVTVEPGLYEPGVGGVRIEDVVAVEEDKVVSFSRLDKDLKLI